jgi:hypothetical protein
LFLLGVGNIGRRSIESFVHEFSRSEKARQDAAVNVEEIATRFHAFMQGHYAPAFGAAPVAQQPAMGFIVAGYSHNEHLGDAWEFVLPQDAAVRRATARDDVGASWRGIGFPFTRLIFGVDPTFEQQLQQNGATAQELQRFNNVMGQTTTRIAFDGMPLQDAIGFCRFIIQTTIGWCTYALGAAACGGPIRLAAITPGSGFQWITPLKRYMEGEKNA